jgi:membrane-bound serine protease (ClpP class)
LFQEASAHVLVLVVLAGISTSRTTDAEEEGQPRGYSNAVLIRLEGEIGPLTQQFIFRKLDAAQQRAADLVVIEIDSPGGTVDESFGIAERLRDIDWAHTVAYIPREALSGGSFVALGCNDIVMAREATVGDAGPIFLPEGTLFFQHVPEKVRSYLERRVRDLAEAKGRPPALAEAMVDNKLVVFRVQNEEGEIGFLSDAEITDAKAADPPVNWRKVKPVLETTDDDFLTLNGVRAVELTLAQGNAASREEIKSRYRVDGQLFVFQWTGIDTTVLILNNRWITGLLFVVGLIALYVEFSAPGVGLGGLVAGLCFSLFFWSRVLGGTAGWLEVTLFVMGLVFLGVEMFVLPGFGISGLTGLLLVIASLVMASQSFAVPDTDLRWNTFLANVLVVVGAMVAAIAVMVALSSYFGTIPILNRLALRPPTPAEPSMASPNGGTNTASDLPLKVGDIGVAASLLRPAGIAFFAEEPYDVVTEGTFIEKGARVKIMKIQGNQVVVRQVDTEY